MSKNDESEARIREIVSRAVRAIEPEELGGDLREGAEGETEGNGIENEPTSDGRENRVVLRAWRRAIDRTFEELGGEQRAALESLLKGETVAEAAKAAGVNRRTVYRWLKEDAIFVSLYNQWEHEVKENCRARLLTMVGLATEAIMKSLVAGDGRCGLMLLKELGMVGAMAKGPVSVELVMKEMELEKMRQRIEHERAQVQMRTALAADQEAERVWKA